MHPRSSTMAIVAIFLISCTSSSSPGKETSYPRAAADKALAAAWKTIGKPYRYAAEGSQAFDCSGLVRYSYSKAGIELPHCTTELKAVTRVVRDKEVRKGDLVFFEENGKKYSHVGIYAGNNRFIHAAAVRRAVRVDSLLDPYWKERFLDARRP